MPAVATSGSSQREKLAMQSKAAISDGDKMRKAPILLTRNRNKIAENLIVFAY